MAIAGWVARYCTFPVFLFGINGLIILLVSGDAPWALAMLVLLLAIGLMFMIERLIPYQPTWNRSHNDLARDVAHFIVNSTLSHVGVLLLPLLASLALFEGIWPSHWPFWLEVAASAIVLDLGISAAHHASHKWNWLWRFHAVHHSVKRMYSLNGLMKHPIHQGIETLSGSLPLLLLGMPTSVGGALAFCVAIQLLLQHSNADYRTGPLRFFFANAEVHRFHHTNQSAEGDVNFGLFTTLWDHFLGTFLYRRDCAPKRSSELGVGGREVYPARYLQQLIEPFRGAPHRMQEANK
jgi:sterol desaturase/sphingolipid hydroxylase (fatty acid hydroxylase superfamily)